MVKMLLTNDAEFVEINILGRMHPDSSNYWDANWLDAKIVIEITSFKACYYTALRVDDFKSFYEELIDLQKNNLEEVLFTTIEEGLLLRCAIKKRGNFICSGQAQDGSLNLLNFKIIFEHNALSRLIAQLEEILKQYPLIGAP